MCFPPLFLLSFVGWAWSKSIANVRMCVDGEKQAPTRLNSESLLDVLYILGFTREEQEALLAD